MIERLIVLGLINSTEYLKQVRPILDIHLLTVQNAQLIAEWCIEYFDKYKEAPGRTIEDIYFDKKDGGGIPKNVIKSIKEDLEEIAGEYDEKFNLKYALSQTNTYLKDRHLERHQEAVELLRDKGELEKAQALMSSYRIPVFELVDDLDLGKPGAMDRMARVFTQNNNFLIEYPGALGAMLNEQLVRGSLVAFMAAEKRGKSWWLLDMAMRAVQNHSKVAFFQAGDMTENQQLKRIASYLTKLPTSDRYTGTVYVPMADCIYNQLDECDRPERRCSFGAFTGGQFTLENIRKEISKEDLVEAFEEFEEEYVPCTACLEYRAKPWGVPWLQPTEITHAVTAEEAMRKIQTFFIDKKRRFKISTHPNNTLTMTQIKGILDKWERIDGFIPEVIIIDYADLMVAEKTIEFRHAQNEIWKNLRALSQERDCLVIAATQANAKAYTRELLQMSDFSEDKRKYAHVTAMFGLNQDKHTREKKIGIMRINQMVVREGEYDTTSAVTVLQSLNLGRPFLDSYV